MHHGLIPLERLVKREKEKRQKGAFKGCRAWISAAWQLLLYCFSAYSSGHFRVSFHPSAGKIDLSFVVELLPLEDQDLIDFLTPKRRSLDWVEKRLPARLRFSEASFSNQLPLEDSLASRRTLSPLLAAQSRWIASRWCRGQQHAFFSS